MKNIKVTIQVGDKLMSYPWWRPILMQWLADVLDWNGRIISIEEDNEDRTSEYFQGVEALSGNLPLRQTVRRRGNN